MESAVIWGAAFVAFVLGNVTGFFGARTQHWWRGVKRGSRHLLPLVRYGMASVIVLVLVGVVGLRVMGLLG